MQMEALEAVHRESRRLPPIQKVSVPEVKKNISLFYTESLGPWQIKHIIHIELFHPC